MDDKQDSVCKLCNVVYLSEKMKSEHLHGKRHLMAMHNVCFTKVKEELGIYVKGISGLKQQEILDLFGKYGTISSSFFAENNYFCIIEFKSAEPVQQLIKMRIITYNGKQILISKRNIKEREAARAAYSDETENFEELHKRLGNLPTFNAQLKWLIDHIQPSYEQTRNKIIALCDDLRLALNVEFGNCDIHVFGSTVTNLYLNNSDIDIYVFVYNTDRSSPSTASLCVNRAKVQLSKYKTIFTNLCAIPHAKTPIVKFLHIPTNMKCDFNFKNMLGVCNSRLIYYYLSLDFKLTPLMIFLKHWAKSHELIGLGGKFSNYAFALMFIFYMQQDCYRFPSVIVLQTRDCLNMQDGWNGGFQRIPTYSKALSEHSLIMVLKGFFEYYANFNYTLNIICPYLGTIVAKTQFLKPDSLSSHFNLYKRNFSEGKPPIRLDNPICIQDPFELNHNVAGGVNADYLKEFTTLCSLAIKILNDQSQIHAMHKLLTAEPEIFERKCIISDSECKFQVLLSATLVQIHEIIKLKNVGEDDEQTETMRLWQDELKTVALDILKKIMQFTVKVIEEPNEKSHRRLDQKDIHDVLHASFKCYGCYNMWDGHRTIKKDLDLDKSKSVMEQQLAINKYIFENLYKGNSLTEKIIEFCIKIEFSKTTGEALFILKNVASKTANFRKFCLYFLKILPLAFQGHINEMLKSLKNESVIVVE